MNRLLLLLISGLSASASSIVINGPLVPTVAGFNPTNFLQAQGNLVSWYVADDYQTNGGSFVILPDRIGGEPLNLTNRAADTRWPLRNPTGLNSLSTLSFDGSGGGANEYLRRTFGTNVQPVEIVTIMKHVGTYVTGRPYDNATGDIDWYRANSIGSPNFRVALVAPSGMFLDGGEAITNKWIVFSDVFLGASSAMHTNNVVFASGDAGTSEQRGFTVGGNFTTEGGLPLEVAQILIYQGALAGTNATTRSNVFWYGTNTYNLAP